MKEPRHIQHSKDGLIISSIALAIPAVLFLLCLIWPESATPSEHNARGRDMAEPCLAPGRKLDRAPSIQSILGVRVRPATSDDISRYSLRSRSGAVITWVNPSGPLGRTGIEVNDIILEINGRPVKSAQDIAHVLTSHIIRGGVIVRALDHRTGRSGYIQLPIP
jgi:membrane-associated protease RseP (regulator of RpoE activity)